MKSVIVAHHHEITLKGNNRRHFENVLAANIRGILKDILPTQSVLGGYGRFVLPLESDELIVPIADRLCKVFGLANVCAGVEIRQDVGEMCQAADLLLKGRKFSTIRIETRRPDKSFATRSMDVSREVGAYVCDKYSIRANMSHPDETIYIEIVNGVAYVYSAKQNGAGGLPVGVSGKVVSLMSAGFDSPVASWQMMKRGAKVIFVHFHSEPYTSPRSVDQVRTLVEQLTQYQGESKLLLVTFADVQNEIVLRSPPPLRIILYRRMMVRIAGEIARREKAEALVTGEAVGQVASQTLRNIRVIDAASEYPILRPLSGADKEETLDIARKIGTHDISKEPYDDCCSFLAPRAPETWADLGAAEEAEAKYDIPAMIAKSIESAVKESFRYPHVDNPVEEPER